MAQTELICVCVAYSGGPRVAQLHTLNVAPGTTAAQAIRLSGVLAHLKDSEVDALTLGIRGRKIAPGHLLQDLDRIELCRPLKVDPKLARRQRFTRQGAKSAGLFAKRREGAKAGY